MWFPPPLRAVEARGLEGESQAGPAALSRGRLDVEASTAEAGEERNSAGREAGCCVREREMGNDFVHDTLIDGRSIRVLAVVDVFTRECVALTAKGVFRGEDVAGVLSRAGDGRQLPRVINVDNGTEFTSRSLDHWAYWNKVRLDFSRPGKPTDNAFIESFNSSLRRECLSQHYFINLYDANRALDQWRDDYNNTRPHSSLGNVPPAHFGAAEKFTPARNQLEKLQIS